MRATYVASLILSLAASPLAARDITLNVPIDCDLGTDCFVQQYVDHDPSDGAQDFRCSTLSYNDHQGTDFALRSIAQMQSGVNVLAAASGTVQATRDGVPDRIFTPDNADSISGRECGNGVVINHGDGWTTQYCHLKRGSVAVQKGDTVTPETILGQVGLSGRTQFPHVHMTLRKDRTVVDPFDPDGKLTCGAPDENTLWDTPPPYRPGGVLSVGFADTVPEFDAIKAGTAARPILPVDAPALVVFGYAFGGLAGDRMRLEIVGPNGSFMDETVVIDKNQAQFFRAVGKKRRADWPEGTYTGTATLIRAGRNINAEQVTVVVK